MSRGCIVTGAASGMGLSCVHKLLAQGAKVTGLDRNPFPEGQIHPSHLSNYHHVEGDVGDAVTVAKLVRSAIEHGGQLHCAINAAGITGRLAPMLEQPDDGLDALLAVNVRGLFLSMKYEAEAMRDTGGGAIVNFSSVYSWAKHENTALYGATKNAVSGLTQGAAVEFAQYGVRVNAVAPGPILTPFIGEVTADIEQAVVRGIPQGRIGKPEEVADVAIWLCSEQASYMTGATIAIDGGQSARLSG